MLLIIWCVAKNLQLDRSPWKWRQWTQKSVGAETNTWLSVWG